MSLKVSRVLHAGYLFESESTRILFDPIFESPFSRNCFSYPEVAFDQTLLKSQKFSAVFISHYHDDHCSLESLSLLDRDTPIYLFCIHPELFEWLSKLGFKHVHSLNIDDPIACGSFKITPTRALDEDVDCIFQIEAAGLKILNMVDSWMTDGVLRSLAQKSPWDLILWPFQTFRELEILSPSRYNFSQDGEIPYEFVEQLKALHARFIVPSSCQFRFENDSWLNDVYFPVKYSDFEKFVQHASAKSHVVRLNPGDVYTLTNNDFKKTGTLPWIHQLSTEAVDYGVHANYRIPTTGEISQNFPTLTKAQRTKTLQFCTKGLLRKYSELASDEAPYFSQLRVWRLSIYDSNESSLDFYYLIQGENISLMGQAPKRFQWWTEIPISRLYGALFEGESLSSLYVRINDCVFPQDIEDDIAEFDPMWDPLLRALYSGRFGSYQKAQLTRIMARLLKSSPNA